MASMELAFASEMEKPMFVEKRTAVPINLLKKGINLNEIPETIVVNAWCTLNDKRLGREQCQCETATINTRTSRKGTLYVHFARSLLNTDDYCRVVIHAHVSNASLNIESAKSEPVTLILYKLVIEEKNKCPYQWMKDEGGKKKCITLRVKIIDSNNEKVTNCVKLQAILIYEKSGSIVPDQNIFLLKNDSKYHSINEDNCYEALFNIRIEDVSFNHGKGNKFFQVLVSPFNHGDLRVIDSAKSVAVQVKSKCNKPKVRVAIATGPAARKNGVGSRRNRHVPSTGMLAFSNHSDDGGFDSVDSVGSNDGTTATLYNILNQIPPLLNIIVSNDDYSVCGDNAPNLNPPNCSISNSNVTVGMVHKLVRDSLEILAYGFNCTTCQSKRRKPDSNSEPTSPNSSTDCWDSSSSNISSQPRLSDETSYDWLSVENARDEEDIMNSEIISVDSKAKCTEFDGNISFNS